MVLDRFRLDGRTAVVTGGAAGLGQAFALAIAEAGARVAVVDRDPALETMQMLGSRGFSVSAELAKEDQVAVAAGRILDWSGGKLDILVNNAGIATPPARLLDVSVDEWDRAITVNLRSIFLVTKALLPELIASGRGSIVNLSSYLALVGVYPGFPVTAIPYATSKAGVAGFTRQLAIEYAKDNVRANAIAPGWHLGTKLGREAEGKISTEEHRRFADFMESSVPMGHTGRPDNLVGLILYLASDASSYLTGQIIAHDGGITAA
jgi:NAD(P)-dependent dehydrogenase (short-subunit alcohol dehydrogenase family)